MILAKNYAKSISNRIKKLEICVSKNTEPPEKFLGMALKLKHNGLGIKM